jgi:deazaflavin-dependent oxidoreductase (nitroreductase family)
MNPTDSNIPTTELLEKIADPRRPGGLARTFSRMQLVLYRLGLGRLLGWRFVHLVHIGRKSGEERHVVLEVVDLERDAQQIFVASGWGERSDWVRNITANPAVHIQIAGQDWPAQARRLTPEESAELLLRYGRKHPGALQNLARVMGYRIQRSEEAYRALGRQIPAFVFEKSTE